jgi:hypothetical protein
MLVFYHRGPRRPVKSVFFIAPPPHTAATSVLTCPPDLPLAHVVRIRYDHYIGRIPATFANLPPEIAPPPFPEVVPSAEMT